MGEDHYAGKSVGEHYGREDLAAKVLDALRAAGKDPDALTTGDLAPIDQLHSRGREATLELAHLAGISPEMHVLDVGGSLGGPARTLASEFGCTVEVLDLTDEFCRAGQALTVRTGLEGRVSFRRGDALHMPYLDATFDLAWTQHSSMNIADKARLYTEIHRVLRPPGEVRALLNATGLKELAWIDETAPALRWHQKRLAATPGDPSPLGPQLVFRHDFEEMLRNQVLNLSEDRIVVIQSLFERQ